MAEVLGGGLVGVVMVAAAGMRAVMMGLVCWFWGWAATSNWRGDLAIRLWAISDWARMETKWDGSWKMKGISLGGIV